MSRNGTLWQDARRAWECLAGWHQDISPPRPDLARRGPGQDGAAVGDEALAALADIGTVRRLLDQVELDAVRTARRQRRSWAEIATRLGVSRQSAWERWRDLDETDERDAAAERDAKDRAGRADDASPAPSLRLAAEALLGQALDEATGDATEEATEKITGKRLRRRSTTMVPNVIGRSWEEARLRLSAASLIGVTPDPDGAPLPVDAVESGSTVRSQAPEAGARVPIGSLVRLWVERGGGSAGVREPRHPTPSPRPARRAPLEAVDEAAG